MIALYLVVSVCLLSAIAWRWRSESEDERKERALETVNRAE